MQKKIENLVAQASFVLRPDVRILLKRAWMKERNPKAKKALRLILKNARVGAQEKLALCQDTGLPVVFIEIGKNVSIDVSFIDKLKRGIAAGYLKNHLRPSGVDPLRRANPRYETGIYHVSFSSRKQGVTITLLPKGFGSENKSRLKMFNPTAEMDEIENFIVQAVKDAGPEACPPFIVGVGIGGTSDQALLLAKEALLERIDKSITDDFLRKLEGNLLRKINALGVGPMGLGGKATALAVRIKTAPTHIAGLPVGVNISCWALRSARITL